MKILVIQLARFGDIYLTWPALRALRRAHPAAEIHLLVRQKFSAAVEGLQCGIVTHELPSAKLLAPLFAPVPDARGCERELDAWLEPLLETSWDQIINLSFSPASSYLADLLARGSTRTLGYTRHSDGYLAIPDDTSAYFYAQVGPGKCNRFHLADIFAMVAGVALEKEDWGYRGNEAEWDLPNHPYLIIHLGASETGKRYSLDRWKEVIEGLRDSGRVIGLIGAKEESALAAPLSHLPNVVSWVGTTELPDLFKILRRADLLIGADSAPIHIASHVNAPILNLSFASVNFWETGPTSSRSYVLRSLTPDSLTSASVVAAAKAILGSTTLPEGVLVGGENEGVRFVGEEVSFEWQLIRALYTESPYPSLPAEAATRSGVRRLREAALTALEQISTLKKNLRTKAAVGILANLDLVLSEIPRLAPLIGPLVRWFQTERLRLAPGSLEETFAKTEEQFQNLLLITEALLAGQEPDLREFGDSGLKHLQAVEAELPACAQQFRLFRTQNAEPILQRLLDHLDFLETNGLHHVATTEVEGVSAWNVAYVQHRELLSRLMQAFQTQDYVRVADLIEYDLQESVGRLRGGLLQWQSAC